MLPGGPGRPVDAALATRVRALTGGNPFLVEELARHLADGRPLGVPSGVRDAVASRTARLSPRCRHLLRTAAVVGRQFPVAVVAATVGRPVMECLDPLDEAAAAGLLEPADVPGEYRFVHALVRDTVEAGLPAGEQVRLHRAAIGAIERYAGERLDPYLGDLARHWAAIAVTGERATAAGWIERAGAAAVRALAFEDGARLHRSAREVGGTELPGEARHRLLVAEADARFRAADAAGAVEAAREAAAVARELGRPDLLAEAALVGGCVNEQGPDRTVRALCEEALAVLGPEPSPRRARLLAQLAETHMYLEDVAAADRASHDALSVAGSGEDTSALVAALRARQIARSGPDGVDERDALATRLLALARVAAGDAAAGATVLWGTCGGSTSSSSVASSSTPPPRWTGWSGRPAGSAARRGDGTCARPGRCSPRRTAGWRTRGGWPRRRSRRHPRARAVAPSGPGWRCSSRWTTTRGPRTPSPRSTPRAGPLPPARATASRSPSAPRSPSPMPAGPPKPGRSTAHSARRGRGARRRSSCSPVSRRAWRSRSGRTRGPTSPCCGTCSYRTGPGTSGPARASRTTAGPSGCTSAVRPPTSASWTTPPTRCASHSTPVA
jgi:hypothetical protein